jgi:hypothetical protein
MERRVRAHQREASRPVEVDLDGIPDGRRIATVRFELVDDLAT